MSTEQDHLLKNAFSLLDFDGDGKLGEDEFSTLLRCAHGVNGVGRGYSRVGFRGRFVALVFAFLSCLFSHSTYARTANGLATRALILGAFFSQLLSTSPYYFVLLWQMSRVILTRRQRDQSLSCRALDVDVDNPHTGRASLVAIAKAVGVKTPLVSYDQVRLGRAWTCQVQQY